MKKITVFAIALMMGALVSTNAMAVVPDLIPVQGTLANSVGEPIDGPTDITFSLYAAETGGTALWTDGFADVDVADGFFTIYLGEDTALDFAALVTNPEIWLGITVESDPEMTRVLLAAVPFAIEAQVCEAVGTLTEADINASFARVGQVTGGGTTTSTTAAQLDRILIDAPMAGFVQVTYTGYAYVNCDATSTTSNMCHFTLAVCNATATTSSVNCNYSTAYDSEDPDNAVVWNAQEGVTLSTVFPVVEGDNYIYLNGFAETGSGLWTNGSFTVLFTPYSLTVTNI